MRELIQAILTPDPNARPTLHEIVDNGWFAYGPVPSRIPASAHESIPDFSYITHSVSDANLATLRRNAKLDDEGTIATPSAVPFPSSGATHGTNGSQRSTTTASQPPSTTRSLEQQEKEFQKAVQPGSPISALLSSARQPLMVAPNMPREQPLLRKLQAAKVQSMRGASQGSAGSAHGNGHANVFGHTQLRDIEEEQESRAEEHRRKELESQKARIVAQIVPEREERRGEDERALEMGLGMEDEENVPPRRTREKARERVAAKEPLPLKIQKAPASVGESASAAGSGGTRVSGFEAAAQVLTAAFEARARGEVFRDPRSDASLQDPKVFIVSWVDYCNKYGMGYALTDGSVGVHFNDSTTIVLAPDKM